MAPPTLTSLPFEIRQLIYRYALPESVEISCCSYGCAVPNALTSRISGEYLARLLQDFIELHNQRLYLLLTDRQTNTDISSFPHTRIVLKICNWTWLSRWTRGRYPRELAMVSGIRMKDDGGVHHGLGWVTEAEYQEDVEGLVEDAVDLLEECYKIVRKVWVESGIAPTANSHYSKVQVEGFFEVKEPLSKSVRGLSSHRTP